MTKMDYQNRPISSDEKPYDLIKVWQVEFKPQVGRTETYVVRGFQEFLDFVKSQIEYGLEKDPELQITINTAEMLLEEYEACEDCSF